jgi:5'-deoxynucleotidase YfbR-like HD superfamily hydrolase
MKMNPVKLYRSGLVQRYHQNPEIARFGQTNAAHQWGVAMLVKILDPNASANLIITALTHDVGEIDVGDLAGPFKRKEPAFTDQHETIEERYRNDTLGILSPDELTIEEGLLLDICDKLEAILFVRIYRADISFTRGWPELIKAVIRDATALGVDDKVKELIDDVSR